MPLSSRRPWAIGAYALAAMLALFELAVLWQALHPQVSEDYRGYYIDRSTTCLPQPVSGAYTPGEEIDFRSGGPDTKPLRPCGWDGPAGDGMHAIGTESRLRFAMGTDAAATLMLELTGVTLKQSQSQRVDVYAGDVLLGALTVPAGETERFTLPVPAHAFGDKGMLEVSLIFPEAIDPGPGMANTMWRSVKLTAASVTPEAPA